MTTTTNEEAILRTALDPWKLAIDRHLPELVATCFTKDAIFQGLHPYSVGREGITEYYDSQPIGLSPEYRILETRRLADDLVLGYLHVDFSFADRPTLGLKLGVLLKRESDGWLIAHYQISRLD